MKDCVKQRLSHYRKHFFNMKLRILYHGNCFDGAASAAIFAKFYRAKINESATLEFLPMMHRAGNLFDKDALQGDENAIVDFKFCADERLTWWFDHHESAFLTPEDESYYRQRNSPTHFLDTSSKSCAEFIARIVAEKYDFRDESLTDLIAWAHTIDGAFYDSATQSVELKEPALQLMQVIEATKDEKFIEQIIFALMTNTLEEVATSEAVQARFKPIYAEHLKTLETMRRKGNYEKGVTSFDLTDEEIEGFNKFIPYYIYDGATYTVALTRGTKRVKISVGSNPWAKIPRTHNIAKICERYGGGGHAVVGAVSLAPGEIEKGRQIMHEIIDELQSAG